MIAAPWNIGCLWFFLELLITAHSYPFLFPLMTVWSPEISKQGRIQNSSCELIIKGLSFSSRMTRCALGLLGCLFTVKLTTFNLPA